MNLVAGLSILICAIGVSLGITHASFAKTHTFKSKTHATPRTRPDVKYVSAIIDKSTLHEVVFAVKQKNVDKLSDILMDVSDPGSPHYGQHWSWKDINTFTRNKESEFAVKNYLKNIDGVRIVGETKFGDFLTVQAPIEVWEKMFATEFNNYESNHPVTNEVTKYVRAAEYSLPTEIADHVEAVHRTVQFSMPVVSGGHLRKATEEEMKVHLKHQTKPAGSAVQTCVTPEFLFYHYNIPNKVFSGYNLVSQAIFASLNQSMSPSDLQLFQMYLNVSVQPIAGDVGGHVNDQVCKASYGNCAEANLDVQYITAMAQKVPTYFDYFNDVGSVINWVDWITGIANMDSPYNVISISYGGYEIGSSKDTLSAFDVQAQKLGIAGTSIFASSGDDGVAGWIARGMPDYCGYYPQFPASSPYVTAVGGTMGPETGYDEVVCQPKYSVEDGIIASGGGFSDYYPMPSWQQAQVSAYFNTVAGTSHAPVSGYNKTGRGYPDVSLLAYSYFVLIGGQAHYLSGTSASAPSFAGLVSTVNAQRKALGLSLLGWINPVLYTYSGAFVRDITVGNNNCTANASPCCVQGFYAAKGWDPATGIGSIDYGKFATTLVYLGTTFPPTVAPTAHPTYVPTATPTVPPTTVNFLANQVINGISLTTYNTNPTLYSSVIVESIADCMTGISSEDITNVMITSPPASASSARRLSMVMTADTTNAIAVSYVVLSTNPSLSYTSVSSQLTTAVSGGAFNSYLNGNAAAASAPALEGCTSSSVTTQSLVASDSSSSDKSLSTGAIAGIVVGSVVGLGLLIGILAWCIFSGKNNTGGGGTAAAAAGNSAGGVTYVENPIAGKA